MVAKNNSPKKRSLRVVKGLSSTPVVAVCSFCSREFKVPMSALSRTVDAQANLQQQFDRHTCQPEDDQLGRNWIGRMAQVAIVLLH